MEYLATFRLDLLEKFHICYPVETALVSLEMALVKKNIFIHEVAFVTVGLIEHDVVCNPNMPFTPSHLVGFIDIPGSELGNISDDSKLLSIISIKLNFECQFVTLIAPGRRYETGARRGIRRYKGAPLDQFFIFGGGIETTHATLTVRIGYVSNGNPTLVMIQKVLLFVNVFGIIGGSHPELPFCG